MLQYVDSVASNVGMMDELEVVKAQLGYFLRICLEQLQKTTNPIHPDEVTKHLLNSYSETLVPLNIISQQTQQAIFIYYSLDCLLLI
jgi:hypothetical protein